MRISPLLLVLLGLGATIVVTWAVRAVRITLALRVAGGAEQREHDMARVAGFLNGLEEPVALLPERAWSDLDMDDVFHAIDRTAGWPGQHLLYARLRREDHSPESLARFEDGVRLLERDDTLRARIRMALAPLDVPRAGALPGLFQRDVPTRPVLAWAFPLLSIAGLAALVATFWWPPLIMVVAGIAVLNVYIRAINKDRLEQVVPPLRMLPAMLAATETLALVDAPALEPHLGALRRAAPKLQWLGRAARWLSLEQSGGNEFAGYVHEYLNILFLLDVTTYAWSLDAFRAEREEIGRAYVALGELDTLQAVATLRLERDGWCRPELSGNAGRAMEVVALTHPLLLDAVPNSVQLDGRSVLLTGSNMSGKSTFIRALGVNALLARTIGTVFAERWRAPAFAVRTSIGRSDSLLEGKSYYRAEVDAIGALLATSDVGARLILIDELFRGTNSIERIAAAKAVLGRLDEGDDLVVVATHDVELLEMLPGYEPFHFREEVHEAQLTFDYQLHHGASSTRNALAILELAGFPGEVVEEARRTATELERRIEHAPRVLGSLLVDGSS